MKAYYTLAAFGFAVLAAAAVWLGGLNQDEGWYLYAANLVADGQMPYRDFFFTQAPLMPYIYSAFSFIWAKAGLLGARILTICFGALGIAYAAGLARRLVPEDRRDLASLVVLLLLGSNLYHLYYVAIPKTYALAGLLVAAGLYALSFGDRWHRSAAFMSGVFLAMASGTRISLGVLLAVVGTWLLFRGRRLQWLWFGLGGMLALALVYGPFLASPPARAGLAAAQAYHAARGGFDVVFTVGSLSRLVRWYLPVFVLLGLGAGLALASRSDGGEGESRGGAAPFGAGLPVACFAAVFAVQMLAPFPYEDYQVPVMGILAAAASALAVGGLREGALRSCPGGGALALLVLGMAWASSFGSPLLEKWTIAGQDRFWSVKKEKCELAQLREVAREIEAVDPGGRDILTQDLYIAVETGRRVPKPLAMGPFSYWGDGVPYKGAEATVLDHEGMKALIASAPCRVAACSGYSFSISAPRCDETPLERQLELWNALKARYELVLREDGFGQNSTPLLVLRRRETDG